MVPCIRLTMRLVGSQTVDQGVEQVMLERSHDFPVREDIRLGLGVAAGVGVQAHQIRDAARKVHIAFGRVSPSLHADMERHCILAALGKEHIFSTLHEALEAARSGEAMLGLPGTKGHSG